ncbi:MAG TPA: ROK family protein [Acidimicrobiia bacterium]
MGDTATFGVDLGGTNLRIALVDPDGVVVADRRRARPSTVEEIVDTIVSGVRDLAPQRPEARSLGVGAAALVDHDGTVHYSPHVPSLIDEPLRARLEDAVGLPAVVDNDANVAVLAELVHGAARGCTEVLLVTLGTGIGGGVVTGGEVRRGAHGFGAEVGHFQVDPNGPVCNCGQRGHWETLASGNALGVLGRERAAAGAAPTVLAAADGSVDGITGVLIGDVAQSGAADALAIVEEYAGRVAVGLVGLVNIFDPELIVVSGGLVELDDVLLAPMRAAFDGRIEGAAHRPEVPIVAAELGEQAGVVGAAVLARELV